MTTALKKTESGGDGSSGPVLVPAATGHLASMFLPETVGNAYLESEWTAERRTQILVQIAQNPEKPKEQLAAIKYLDDLAEKILLMNGQIVKGTRQTTQATGDRTVTETANLQVMAQSATEAGRTQVKILEPAPEKPCEQIQNERLGGPDQRDPLAEAGPGGPETGGGTPEDPERPEGDDPRDDDPAAGPGFRNRDGHQPPSAQTGRRFRGLSPD